MEPTRNKPRAAHTWPFGRFRSTGGEKIEMTGEHKEQSAQQGEHHAHHDRQGPQ
jgi:hypothetical protein